MCIEMCMSSPGRPPIKVLDCDRRSKGTSASSLRPDLPSTSSRVWLPEIVTWISWLSPSHRGAGELAMMTSPKDTRTNWRHRKKSVYSSNERILQTHTGLNTHISPFIGAGMIVSQGDGERDSVLVNECKQHSDRRRWTQGQLDAQVLRFYSDENRKRENSGSWTLSTNKDKTNCWQKSRRRWNQLILTQTNQTLTNYFRKRQFSPVT